MQLYVVRPLQRHPALQPPLHEEVNVLALATAVLSDTLSFAYTDEPWAWFTRGFVNWHPLAVMLAELCMPHTDLQLVEKAWTVARKAYALLGEDIAEGLDGPLWKPIKKLMRSAEMRRFAVLNHARQAPEFERGQQPAGPVDTLLSMEQEPPVTQVISQPHDLPMDGGQPSSSEDLAQSWMYWENFLNDFTGLPSTDWLMDFPADTLTGNEFPNLDGGQ